MWISPEFAVQVMDWIFRLLSGDLTLVEDLVERHEAANAGVQVMATVTAAGPETSPESLSLLHRYNALQQEHEKLKVQVAQVTRNATTGEAELTVLRGRVLELTGRNTELAGCNTELAGTVVTLKADAQEQTRRNGELPGQVVTLEVTAADAQELRAATVRAGQRRSQAPAARRPRTSAGRCGQFHMRGDQEEGGENLGRTGWPILHLRKKQFTNTHDDCALQEHDVVPQDPLIQGMSGDAEGFRRIHERHGDVQREERQENERLVAPTDH